MTEGAEQLYPHKYSQRNGLDWCRYCGETENHPLHVQEKRVLLVQITPSLWIDPNLVVSVETVNVKGADVVRLRIRPDGYWHISDMTIEAVIEKLEKAVK